MTNKCKRIATLLLAACMLLTLSPLGAYAVVPTYTYDFVQTVTADGIVSNSSVAYGTSYAPQTSTTWAVAHAYNNLKLMGSESNYYLQMKATVQYSFVAFHLKNVEDGIYSLTWTNGAPQSNASKEMQMGIYVLPYSSFSAASAGSTDSLPASEAKGTYTSLTVTQGTIEDLTLAGDASGYVVIFRLDSADYVNRFFRINSISLTKRDHIFPSFDPVSPEVVAENAITDIYYTFAAGSVVNGHDYLYLALRGGVLAIYDMDAKRVLDTETLSTSLPRSIYIDENGIVWICGSAGLFRYDPFTLTGTDIPFPKNSAPSGISVTYGVTGDGNGKLYFGTGNRGYLGMYDTATETYTWISGELDSDVKQVGYAGLVYKDGYLYLGIDGDMNADGVTTHDIIKYDVSNQSIVSRLDISYYVGAAKYVTNLNLVGDVLFCSFGGESSAFYVDISGTTMQLKNFSNALQHAGEVSEVMDGKVYFRGRFKTNNSYGPVGYIVYDIATETCSQLPQPGTKPPALKLTTGNLVTVEGLSGQSIMVPINNEANNCINLYFYNLQTGEEVTLAGELDISDNIEAGFGLRAPTLDPTGQYIYVGAGNNSLISKYSVAEGKVVESFYSYNYQTDSLLYHDGYLYSGNYSAGTVTRIDPVTKATTPLFSLRYSAFEQCRMWCTTFGGNKVFAGTTPYSGFGGMLAWYDFDTNLTYVAGGPNPEDVYYADTSGLTDSTNIATLQYTWYNAVTGEVADFDDDNDGMDDPYLTDGTRRFRGPIENQVITNLIYKDGLLYGTTTASGSSGAGFGTENAVLFVYDVAAKKVIATCDLSTKLTGFTNLVEGIDQLAEDPDVPGKFWGVISGTLFTMTFDVETKQFTVTEELSFLKDVYSAPGMVFNSRDIIFDGPCMYVAFNRSVGTYMILKDDPTQYRQISTYSPNQMVLAADGNLYWTTNQSIYNDPSAANHLYKFSIAQYRLD